MTSIEKGTLLLASPEINTGLFHRSVILICEHSPAGSFGLILNKPLHAEVPAEVLDPESVTNPRLFLRAGGPIQPGQMMLLHGSNTIPDQTLEVCDGVFLGGDLDFLQKTATDASGPPVHLCFGYTGWSSGLLEQEDLSGAWFSIPATASLIFDTPPDKLWQTALQAMGGKHANLANLPENLDLN